MRAARSLLMAGLLLSPAAPCAAQEDYLIDLFRPRLDVGLDSVGPADFTDLDMERFSQDTLSVRLNVPIGKAHLLENSSLIGYQFFTEAYILSSNTEISFLEENPRLYSGGIQFTGLALSQGLNLFIGNIGVTFAEEEETLDSPDARFNFFGAGTYRTSENFWLGYGGAFTHQYGEARLFPLVGFYWKINDRWSLGSLAPFFARGTYAINPRLKLNLQAGVVGENYQFANEPESDGDPVPFPGEPDVIHLRTFEGRLGAELEYSASARFAIVGQIGVNGGRRLEFADTEDNEIISEEIDPSGFLWLALRTTFGTPTLLTPPPQP